MHLTNAVVNIRGNVATRLHELRLVGHRYLNQKERYFSELIHEGGGVAFLQTAMILNFTVRRRMTKASSSDLSHGTRHGELGVRYLLHVKETSSTKLIMWESTYSQKQH